MKKMKSLDAKLLKIFLFGLPAIAVLAAFAYFYSTGAVNRGHGLFRLLNEFAGLSFAVWMLISIYLSIRLVASEQFREQVIARLTFMRERDEREAMLTGRATRTTFLTSLAILVFLFCLSCFQISIYRVPPERAVDGKTGFISLGLGFALLDHSRDDAPGDALQKRDFFSYSGLPVSSTTVILFLIVWHVFSYNYSMRRLRRWTR